VIDGPDCGYLLAPLAKLNHKYVPMVLTLLWRLTHYLQLLGDGTRSIRVEHLEAFLFEWKPNKRHFGSNKQWSGSRDTDGVAMIPYCNHRT